MLITDINEEKCFEYSKEWVKYKGYLPLLLHRYIDSLKYLNNSSDKVLNEFYTHREELQYSRNYSDYLINDLVSWLDENPEYKDIIKTKE